jgi:AsmA protein
VLTLLPTGWARARVVARLAPATGRPVGVGGLRVGFLGGLHLGHVTIAAPGSEADPWLRAGDARVNISLLQLLYGQIDPTDLEVNGLVLRILRRADGTFEPADADAATATARPPSNGGDAAERSALRFRFADARITLIDEPTDTRLELTEVEGRGIREGHRTTITELRGTLNGGRVELAAQLDRSGPVPAFEGDFRALGVGLDRGMGLLAYLAPVLDGSAAVLQGRLNLNVTARGAGTGRDDLRRSLVGQGSIALDPVQLDGSPLVAELADVLDVPPRGRVGAVRSDFVIRGGRVVTDSLTIDLARFPIVLSGWTDFNGRLDYRLATDRLVDRLPDQARDLLADLQLDPTDLTSLRVCGTVDRLSVTRDGRPLRETLGTSGERQKLRELSRRLKDRILR